jgi:threonine dehydratase
MVTLEDIQAARERIAPFVHRTPIKHSHTLTAEFGCNIYFKYELFQKTGSFKPRGAVNQILMAGPDARTRGVVGFSGGNFAQGAAFAGAALGIPTTIVMPEVTPRHYMEATRAYGAVIHTVPDITQAIPAVEEHVRDGLIPIHPYDNPNQVAGNGTAGLEIAEDVPQATDVVISIGGGGWIYGLTVALKALVPKVRIWAVETEKSPTMHLALEAGHPVTITPQSIARTLGAPIVSADALAMMQKHLHRLILVTDEEAIAAQRFLLERAKVLAELAAAATLAAARKVGGEFGSDRHVVLVLCGGNESLETLASYNKLG